MRPALIWDPKATVTDEWVYWWNFEAATIGFPMRVKNVNGHLVVLRLVTP